MRTLLLTPGPLTTTERTRAAMQRDWGSRDADFIALSEGVRARLLPLCGADPATHMLIPLQGSGTFAVEAMVQTLVPREGVLLVLVNGAYGRRLAEIAGRLGRAVRVLQADEDRAFAAEDVDKALRADPAITDVALIHLETTSGLLNPLAPIAKAVARHGCRLLVDAIGSLGASPIPGGVRFAGLAGSANKGLEGVPGLAFVCAERAHLQGCAGTASSLSLDLHAQAAGFAQNGQWRFTPPTHVVAALHAALDQLDEEGGVAARTARYAGHCELLRAGLSDLGFAPYLPAAIQGPVIVTFRPPAGDWFDFASMYDFLHARGVVIYPGKLTGAPSFRIGCIGAIDADDIRRAIGAIADYVAAYRHGQAAAD